MKDPLQDIWDEPDGLTSRIPVDRYRAPPLGILRAVGVPSAIGATRSAQAYWRQRTLEAWFLLALGVLVTGLIFALVR